MQNDSEEDEFGVNDKYFNFRDYKYPGVNLRDIEDPAVMEDLFPEKYVTQGRNPLASLMNIDGNDPNLMSSLGYDDDAGLLGAF